MHSKADILARLELGSSVAENDDNLEAYFVPTVAMDDFVSDRYDLIRGAKGSGKSAILRIVSRNQAKHTTLNDVELVIATEHTGEPAFKRAFEPIILENVADARLADAWKTYLLNLALDALERLPESSEKKAAVEAAEASGLRYRTVSSFKKIWWSILRILNLKSVTVKHDAVTAEFPDAPPEFWRDDERTIDFPEILRLVCSAFEVSGKRCWVLIDRLDAAFQDRAELERRALRALLTAYKDFMGQRRVRFKLFFRTDLYDVVVGGTGFRELTHVADRASPPINWDGDKLLQMIMERFAFNQLVCEAYGFSRNEMQDPDVRSAAFFSIFPNQIDAGKRKPDSWNWMLSRIRDGNNARTPRDLHGLVKAAGQSERELLALGQGDDAKELISADAVKNGLTQLSTDKVRTALIAENPDLEEAILMFKGQKAEQDPASLARLLGEGWSETAEQLVRIGFLEKLSGSWKVPMLYRDGLGILQGAAFEKTAREDD